MPSPVDVPVDLDSMLDANIAGAKGLVGSVISGRYRIESLLGEGGMGAVYLAEHTLMRKRLAVKVLHPEMTRVSEVVARFEREAMAAAHIEHPNVAAATDFGKLDDGSFFLVLEYVEGRGLRDALLSGNVGVARSLHIAKQIAQALARAHGLGIVHRDLKPENVMLVERDGDPDFVKVLDFGIAKVPVAQLAGGQGEALTRAGMVFGTPEYMSPEQALGKDVDHRADLYALGVILYEMLAGHRPFEADTAISLLGMHITQPPPSIARHAPATIEALVMRLLEKEPGARFQHAREVIEAIDTALVAEGYATVLPGTARGSAWSGIRPHRRFAWLEPLRAKLPPQLAKQEPALLLAGGVLGALVIAVLLVVSLGALGREGDAKGAASQAGGLLSFAKPEPPQASDAELANAADAGAEALVELVGKYPADVDAMRALARAERDEARWASAMATVEKLLGRDPKLAGDPEIQAMVLQAARSKEASDAAFALLEGPLGSSGVDALYELTSMRGVPQKAVNRANQSLRRPEIRAKASPALLVALDLRAASTCPAKKALMPKIEEQGDARILPPLRQLTKTVGCGFVNKGDCWPCLRDGSLAQALKAVEARVKE